ncbi:MAG TPA: pilus assembly protein [Candidatus Dorea intestinavium]|nr:pilus assembly protein [Candidatus Dorea intestinavium]
MKKKRKKLKGSATIEMAVIVPLILGILMLIIFTIFYFHDKNIITASLMEVVMISANKDHDKAELTVAEIEDAIAERIDDKCIFLQYSVEDIELSKEKIKVEVTAQKGRFKTRIYQSMPLLKPEKEIREEKRWKSILP